MNIRKIIIILLFVILIELRFVYIPGQRRISVLDKRIAEKQKDKMVLLSICEEYKNKRDKEETLKIAGAKFSLLSYIGDLIEKRKLEKNLVGLQPLRSEQKEGLIIEKIKVSLKGITLEQVYHFLTDIEKTSEIYTSEFRMQKLKDTPHFLDVEIELFVLKNSV